MASNRNLTREATRLLSCCMWMYSQTFRESGRKSPPRRRKQRNPEICRLSFSHLSYREIESFFPRCTKTPDLSNEHTYLVAYHLK